MDWDKWKAGLAWVGTIVGGLTLSKLVLIVTLVYTSMQAYVFWRDKVRKPPRHRR